MATELESDLDRLRELLTHTGPAAIVRRPIVLPDPSWFPDRWTPDLESDRLLTLRLLAYADLSDLDAECGSLVGAELRPWLPRGLQPPQTGQQAAGLFLGIQDKCAYFRISLEYLSRAEDLTGILAHEVAHAWRRSQGIEGEDRQEEEQSTDLTTVVLGFAILTANAAYRYEAEGHQRGVYAATKWSHYSAGYLGPDRLARLFAVQCLIRGEDSRRMGAFLGVTQRAAFTAACSELDPIELRERLGIGTGVAQMERPMPPIVKFRQGRAARLVHACSEGLVQELGENGGTVAEPRDVEFFAIEARHVTIGSWGRPHRSGGWLRTLQLVEDPEWAASLLLLECLDDGIRSARVVGLIPDRIRSSRGKLSSALEPFFAQSGLDLLVHGELPTFVVSGGREPLGIGRLGDLLRRSVERLGAVEVSTDLASITESTGLSFGRVHRETSESAEREPTPMAGDIRRLVKKWWDHASEPTVVSDEWGTLSALTERRFDSAR